MATTGAAPARLADPELHGTGNPHELWRWMRAHAPVYRHPPGDLPAFWSLTRYEDVRAVYRDAARFSSAYGVMLRPTEIGEDPGAGLTLALTDPPRHKQLRALIADWFTERSARSLEESMHGAVRRILRRVLPAGECEFAHEVATRLTLYVVSGVMGVPEDDQEEVFAWTTQAFDAGRPLATHQQLMQYFVALMDRRAAEPADDVVSALMHGAVDDELLSEEEVLLNCENLLGAAENAGLAMASGMLAFVEHPDEWRRVQDDRRLLPLAIEEILRWTSSATHSMRTVTAPATVRGQALEPGERVVLWIPSANRDEDVFEQPDRFDVARRPNRHLALGAGEHFCIGSTLARAQMRALFSELLDAVDRVEVCGDVVPLRSLVVNGPAALPVRFVSR